MTQLKRDIISFYNGTICTGRKFAYYTVNNEHNDFYKLLIDMEEKRSKYYKYTYNNIMIKEIKYTKDEIRVEYILDT